MRNNDTLSAMIRHEKRDADFTMKRAQDSARYGLRLSEYALKSILAALLFDVDQKPGARY